MEEEACLVLDGIVAFCHGPGFVEPVDGLLAFPLGEVEPLRHEFESSPPGGVRDCELEDERIDEEVGVR